MNNIFNWIRTHNKILIVFFIVFSGITILVLRNTFVQLAMKKPTNPTPTVPKNQLYKIFSKLKTTPFSTTRKVQSLKIPSPSNLQRDLAKGIQTTQIIPDNKFLSLVFKKLPLVNLSQNMPFKNIAKNVSAAKNDKDNTLYVKFEVNSQLEVRLFKVRMSDGSYQEVKVFIPH